MTSNEMYLEEYSTPTLKILEDTKLLNILSTPNSKTSLKTKSLSKQKKSKRRECTPDSPPNNTFQSYSAFWSQLRNKHTESEKYIEPKALFTENRGKSKFLNMMEEAIIEENDKEDKLFKNLFGNYSENFPTKEENDHTKITNKISAIMKNLNENDLDIIDIINTKVVLINESLNSTYMKASEFKNIFIKVEPDFSQMISSLESNCFIVKAKLFLKSLNQIKGFNSRFIFNYKELYEEIILSEVEVHLM